MNLQEEIKALKQRIAELEEIAKEEQEFPQVGDEYWRIDDKGSVDNSLYNDYYTDNNRQSIGNFFQTEQQAEFAVEKLTVEAELRKFSIPFKRDTLNFIMCLDTDEDKICRETKRLMVQGALYFENIYQLDKAIEAVGIERIKKYIFGVEE
ncbi:hypothetical protein ACN2A0_02490 [Aerococcus viridans]